MLDQIAFFAPDWRDLVEILIVATILYRILVLLAGTRAIQMLLGLFLVIGIYFLARLLKFDLIIYLLGNISSFGVIAALVVFQPELRSALAHLGRNKLWRRFASRLEVTEVAEELAQAAMELSRAKVGGIIAIEGEVGLGEYAETGTPLQARVSAALLNTIFSPYSPLHDGAVIIRGDTIVAAGAILPLTQFPVADKSMGTRHRAAIGLSEETDAFILVISEETSCISIASRGRIERDFDHDRLVAALANRNSSPEASLV